MLFNIRAVAQTIPRRPNCKTVNVGILWHWVQFSCILAGGTAPYRLHSFSLPFPCYTAPDLVAFLQPQVITGGRV